MNSILIADDDKDLAEGIKWYLEAENLRVLVAHDGEEALEVFRREKPLIVVLDVMMPRLDGMKVCEAIRAESDSMIMMLSARDAEIDKVRALKLGADDYMTKPFGVSELVARVQALLRRSPKKEVQSADYKYDSLEISLEMRTTTVLGHALDLTAMEFDLLAAMMKRRMMVFTRDQIVELIWKDNFFGDMRLVDNLVYKLRDKLAKAGLPDFPIVTVRGVGYAFRPED